MYHRYQFEFLSSDTFIWVYFLGWHVQMDTMTEYLHAASCTHRSDLPWPFAALPFNCNFSPRRAPWYHSAAPTGSGDLGKRRGNAKDKFPHILQHHLHMEEVTRHCQSNPFLSPQWLPGILPAAFLLWRGKHKAPAWSQWTEAVKANLWSCGNDLWAGLPPCTPKPPHSLLHNKYDYNI